MDEDANVIAVVVDVDFSFDGREDGGILENVKELGENWEEEEEVNVDEGLNEGRGERRLVVVRRELGYIELELEFGFIQGLVSVEEGVGLVLYILES